MSPWANLYQRLPVVRELRLLNAQVSSLREELRALRSLQAMSTWEALRAEKVAKEGPRSLHAFEHQVCSQHGEDGVLQEIFHRVGAGRRTFVEVGTGDGRENNTAFLLGLGWKGAWLDLAAPERDPGPDLRFRRARASRENIADLFRELEVPEEVDLCSLDIDQNTFHLWQALAAWRPRVVVVEYNASIPPAVDWRAAYDGTRTWDQTINFGASLKAFETLGRERGYALVHCELAGANAFFVRHDLLADRFPGPHDAETHYEPPRYLLDHRAGHANGRLDRLEIRPPAPDAPSPLQP